MIQLLPLRLNIPIIFLVLATLLVLFCQFFRYTGDTANKTRLWHALFLSLVLLENITENLIILPDNILPWSQRGQEILREASGYIVSGFIPLYAYLVTGYKTLKHHAWLGFLCILLPTFAFFIFYYPRYGNLVYTRRLVYIIPFLYGLWGFSTIIRGAMQAYRRDGDKRLRKDRICMIIALGFWSTGPVIGAWLGGSRCMIGLWGCTPPLLYNIYYLFAQRSMKALVMPDAAIDTSAEQTKAEPEPEPVIPEVVENVAEPADASAEMYDKLALLTARENEIAGLICQGLTSKAISEKLFISEATVKTHTSNLYKKLEIKNKMELRNKMTTFTMQDSQG
ncbi:MAG: LuxR family transcriptional regulator [Sphingobacteriales bacterium]|nr:MAG: LuxR family transcriptional regulator [Sphingobacteriales bacterium]